MCDRYWSASKWRLHSGCQPRKCVGLLLVWMCADFVGNLTKFTLGGVWHRRGLLLTRLCLGEAYKPSSSYFWAKLKTAARRLISFLKSADFVKNLTGFSLGGAWHGRGLVLADLCLGGACKQPSEYFELTKKNSSRKVDWCPEKSFEKVFDIPFSGLQYADSRLYIEILVTRARKAFYMQIYKAV